MLFLVITLVMSYHDYCYANLCHWRDSSGGSSCCGWQIHEHQKRNKKQMWWVSHGVCLVLQIFSEFRHGSRTRVNVLRAHQAGRGLASFLGIQARWNCSSFPSILWDGWQRLQVSCNRLFVTTHTSPNSGLKVLSRRAIFSTFLGLYKEWCYSRHTIPSPVWSTYYGKIHFIVTIILQDLVTCEITAHFKFRKTIVEH